MVVSSSIDQIFVSSQVDKKKRPLRNCDLCTHEALNKQISFLYKPIKYQEIFNRPMIFQFDIMIKNASLSNKIVFRVLYFHNRRNKFVLHFCILYKNDIMESLTIRVIINLSVKNE